MKMKKIFAMGLSAVMMMSGLASGSNVLAAYTDAQLMEFGNNGYTENEIANNAVSLKIAYGTWRAR